AAAFMLTTRNAIVVLVTGVQSCALPILMTTMKMMIAVGQVAEVVVAAVMIDRKSLVYGHSLR
ncbi:hypothetical protein ABTD57_18085, partial [Acinetobacter baumannii]